MKSLLISLHALLAALWLGCILTEALFERALLTQGPDSRTTLAKLHVRVDQWIELPALLGVLVTGTLMVTQPHATGPAFTTMLWAGMVGILANLVCVRLVFQRRDAALANQWQRFERLDHLQHQVGAVVLVGVVVALVAGYAARRGM